MSAKLISIIGPPGCGKTTLAEYLCQELPAEMIREDYAGNPFLAESFSGTLDMRLASQLYFLMSRARQLSQAIWPDDGICVSDYGFCQDGIYAELLLNDQNLQAYHRVACYVPPLVHSPELLICLDAKAETLRERIAERGREFETALTTSWLENMRAEYTTVPAWAECPVITVDTEAMDLRNAEHRAKLLAVIRQRIWKLSKA